MKKTYILHNEIAVEEGCSVNCIYLVYDDCLAQPFARQMNTAGFYRPNEEEKKEYCIKPSNWENCPRFLAYQKHLRAIGLQK